MSFLVLHMDKFKKEAVRGIQSHNRRERHSHSNPDIEYDRSSGNYELCENAPQDYARAVQNRIDDLLLVKAVRKDAVHVCGVIVSSDAEFFKSLSPEETRKFFSVCKEYLTMFVGGENIISAMVHMDEKTPHMHFLHVPITRDGRLNANSIYTRESLKNLQTGLPEYLQMHGFDIQRGVEQAPGSAKKHLNTREFKQQQNALDGLRQETETVNAALKQDKQRESALKKRLQFYEQQAQEAEKVLAEKHTLPEASMFNYKPALEQARRIIEQQVKALAVKNLVAAQKENLQAEVRELGAKVARLDAEKAQELKNGLESISRIMAVHDKAVAELESYRKFVNQPEIMPLHVEYIQQKRQDALRKEAEQKALEQERRLREEQEREQARLSREREARQRERQLERSGRGMGMGR